MQQVGNGKLYSKFIFNSIIYIAVFLLINNSILYFNISGSVQDESSKTQISYLEILNKQINTQLQEIVNGTDLITDYISSSGLMESIMEKGQDQYEFNRIGDELNKQVGYFMSFTRHQSIFVVHSSGYSFLFSDYSETYQCRNKLDLKNFEILKQMEDSGDKKLLITSAKKKSDIMQVFNEKGNSRSFYGDNIEGNMNNYLTVAVRGTSRSGIPFVVFAMINLQKLIIMNEDIDRKNLVILNDENELLYYDKTGNIDYDNNFSQYVTEYMTGWSRTTNNGRRGRVFYAKNEYCRSNVFYFIPDSIFNKSNNKYLLISFAICIASILLMTGIMVYFSKKQLIGPLQRLLMVSQDKREKGIPQKWIYSHKKADISLRNRFVTAFTIAFLIPNIILAYTGYLFNRMELESLRMDYMEAVTDSIVRDVDSLIYNYSSMIKDLIFNNEIQYVMNYERFPLDYEHRSRITQAVLKTKFNREGLLNVKIYKTNGDLLYSLTGGEQYSDENIFNEIPALKGKNLKTISMWSFSGKNTQSVEINLLREIRSFGEMAIIDGVSREFEKIGYLSISISEISLLKAYDNAVIPLNGIAVVDSDNMVISCSNSFFNGRKFLDFQDEIYKQIGAKDCKVMNKTIPSNRWKVMLLMDYNDIRDQVKNNILLSFYLVFFVFFIMLFLTITLIGRMIMPIERLNYDVRSISEKGGFLTTIKENVFGYDEIDNLGRSYNSLIDRINTLIRTVYLEEVKRANTENKKKEAEMNALQAQINPHFIYNTLESINWIIKLNRNEEASRMIKLFSDLLHVSVDRRNLCVSIEEELNHIDIYIKLQQIRYKGRLAFINNVPEKIMKYKTLKLLLQPLVENAIMHGMSASDNVLTIFISAAVQDNSIVINIADDGAGIAEDKLNEINEGLKADSMESIGVKNVNDRIQLYFGNQYYLKLNSVYGEGTKVIIKLPVIE